MQKINQIFGKEVINQTSGEKIATVQDVVLDSDTRHIVALVIRGGGLMGSSSVVRWGAVVSVGDVVVVQAASELPSLKDDSEVSELVKQSYRITGTAVISDKGEQLGTVGDMYVNERGEILGYEVKHGLLKGSKYLPAEHVQAAGKDAVISRLAELPRMKDIDTDQSEGTASGVAGAGAVAAPGVATLGAQDDMDTASTYGGATAVYDSDAPVVASSTDDSYSYTTSEPAAVYSDTDDTAAPAYSADIQDEPARIYADDTSAAYTADTDQEPVAVYTEETTADYNTAALDEPVAFGAEDAAPAYSTDTADEPVMGDPDVVAYSTDPAEEPVARDVASDMPAYQSEEAQEPVASSDPAADAYANKSNQM